MRPRQRVTGMQRSSYLGVSPPLDTRVQRIRVLKLPMARRRLTTVPGPDPVMPAAHERASTVLTGHPAAQYLSLDDLSAVAQSTTCVCWNSPGIRSRRALRLHVTSWSSKLLNAKNDRASRPFPVRAGAQVRPLTRQLAPSSRPKLALFFCSVSRPPLSLFVVFFLFQKHLR